MAPPDLPGPDTALPKNWHLLTSSRPVPVASIAPPTRLALRKWASLPVKTQFLMKVLEVDASIDTAARSWFAVKMQFEMVTVHPPFIRKQLALEFRNVKPL